MDKFSEIDGVINTGLTFHGHYIYFEDKSDDGHESETDALKFAKHIMEMEGRETGYAFPDALKARLEEAGVK